MPIQYPPHTVALGSIYVAALLATIDHPDSPESSPDPSSRIIAKTLGQHGEWERKYQAQVEDLEGELITSTTRRTHTHPEASSNCTYYC